MSKTLLRTAMLVAGALGVASPAFAHPGHDEGLGSMAGALHPLTGMDHLLVMVLVGLWGGLAFGRRGWACPLAFVGCMLAGFGWARMGGALPCAETLILLSLGAVGAVLMVGRHPPLAAAVAIVGVFAVAHGHAHGAEMPASASTLPYAAGFAATTIVLHVVGLSLARVSREPWVVRGIGAMATLTAAAMLWSA